MVAYERASPVKRAEERGSERWGGVASGRLRGRGWHSERQAEEHRPTPILTTMPIDPPIRDVVRYPFTCVIALGAIIVSVNWWAQGHWADPFFIEQPIESKPWTLVTSTLPHVSAVHLAFNLVWWWSLGARVERAWGGWKAGVIFVLLAVFSSAAEFAFLQGGVGLSGVVYGLCTLIWVAQAKVPALAGTITKRTLQFFGVWFIVCIVFTITGFMPVANIAHGAGALVGWILGKCLVAERRASWIAVLVTMIALVGVGATVARPTINFSPQFRDNGYKGWLAGQEGRYEDAARLLEDAAKERPTDVAILTNLGIAYVHLNRKAEALQLFEQVIAFEPSARDELAPFIASSFDFDADAAAKRGDLERVRSLAAESLRWNPAGTYAKQILLWADEAENSVESKIEGP